jgi:DNA polymerase elongation subunit (family B)
VSLWAFDIETDMTARPFGDGVPAGLDPRVSRVTSVAVAGPRTWVVSGGEESDLLAEFWTWLLTDVTAGDVVGSWNGGLFDWPFLLHRSTLAGVHAPVGFGFRDDREPVRGTLPTCPGVLRMILPAGVHVDCWWAYRPMAAHEGISSSLKSVAAFLGVPLLSDSRAVDTPEMTPAELAVYNLSDAYATLTLLDRCRMTANDWSD